MADKFGVKIIGILFNPSTRRILIGKNKGDKNPCLSHKNSNDTAANKHKRECRQIKQRLIPLFVNYESHLPLSLLLHLAKEYFLEVFIFFCCTPDD